MRILIIEDEAVSANRLENMVQEILPECKIVAKTGSVKDSVRWLMNHEADLIFLDIQLSDGLCFNIFEQVQVATPVIFTTAYDQYAIKAFRLNSISYLLKPIKKNELQEALQKYRSMKSAFGIDFESLLAQVQGKQPEYKKRFLVRIGDKLQKIETSDIAFFYALDKCVFCKTFVGQTLPVDFSLDALDKMLDPDCFFRINRHYLVQMKSIENMLVWSRSRIRLKLKPAPDLDKDPVVSIERSADFKRWMDA